MTNLPQVSINLTLLKILDFQKRIGKKVGELTVGVGPESILIF